MIRVVTEIEELDKRRSKIYIDQEFAFVLYKGEIVKYKIETKCPIEDSTYDTIRNEVLVKRAKKRCLNLLQKRPYTECKLREKLAEGYYAQDIIDEAMEYVKSFHYIDDYDYACRYIFYHKESEARKKMEEKLLKKGINREIIRQAFDASYENAEEQQELELKQAQNLLEKKHFDVDNVDWKEKKKIYAFLLRKGISASVIRKVIYLQDDAVEYI